MNNDKDDKRNDFFSRSIRPAFAAGFQPEDLSYTRPVDADNALAEFQGKKRKSRNPWDEGWHNGFPPPATSF